MKSLQILLLICSIFTVFNQSLQGQQWNGEQNTTGDISRTGNVGLGTDEPSSKLHIVSPITTFSEGSSIRLQAKDIPFYWDIYPYSSNFGTDNYLIFNSNLDRDRRFAAYFRDLQIRDENYLEVMINGSLGIGMMPNMAEVQSNGRPRLDVRGIITTQWLDVKTSGNISKLASDELTTNSLVAKEMVTDLFTTKELTTNLLRITGGADIAEPFIINDLTLEEEGLVVVIDENKPGQLRLSTEAYDKKVAGVISGANDLKPGMILYQEGKIEGELPVALTGRVYVKANSSNGNIQPGDLLTTSSTLGEAMKVTDFKKAQGAILGKAMTPLQDEHGLVLVLVTLQ